MKTATIGAISSGTMRNEDLIPCFAYELAYLASDELTEDHKSLIAEADALEDYDSADACEILSELSNALQKHAPAYFYFGSHTDDGACYGFWLPEEFESEFDGLKVSDTSEVPDTYLGEVLHVNDHGNMTLYSANAGQLTEVWGVV